MAFVDASGFFKRMQRLRRFIKSPVADEIITEMAEMARDMIYKRVKAGFGVNSDDIFEPSKQRLLKLSPSYIRYRKGLVRFFRNKNGRLIAWRPPKGNKFPSPVTGEFGTPGKSNLTLTGQMLNSMTYKKKKKGFIILIPATRRHDPFRKKQVTNKKVAEWVSESRPFLALTDKEQLQLQKFLARNVRDKLRKLRSKV